MEAQFIELHALMTFVIDQGEALEFPRTPEAVSSNSTPEPWLNLSTSLAVDNESRLHYVYAAIDRHLLIQDGGVDKAKERIQTYIKALVGGRAAHLLIERGNEQTRSLVVGFLSPHPDLKTAVEALEATREGFAKCYGDARERIELNIETQTGTLGEILDFTVDDDKSSNKEATEEVEPQTETQGEIVTVGETQGEIVTGETNNEEATGG